MLGEYKVSRCSRQCAVEKRPLLEGEAYYSVVVAVGDEQYERRDYSAGAWEGPPEGTIGHWKNRMPVAGEKTLVLAPREVLVDVLRQMASGSEPNDSTAAKLAYLLALMMLRRRLVRITRSPATQPKHSQSNVDDDEPQIKWIHLEVIHDGSTIDVAECAISRGEAESLSESLNELLYCEAGERDEG